MPVEKLFQPAYEFIFNGINLSSCVWEISIEGAISIVGLFSKTAIRRFAKLPTNVGLRVAAGSVAIEGLARLISLRKKRIRGVQTYAGREIYEIRFILELSDGMMDRSGPMRFKPPRRI